MAKIGERFRGLRLSKSAGNKKGIFILITIVLIFFVSFAIAEAVIRVYHHVSDRDRFIWIPDQYQGYVHTGNNEFLHHYTEDHEITVKHKVNSFGFMGEDISLIKPDDTFRVLVLGDSYTEAIQVVSDENFCKGLQNLIKENNSSLYKNIEVLNAGVSGYSPSKYYLYFKRELARLNPDLVIVQLFANDVFEDNVATKKSVLDENGLPLKIDRYFSTKHLQKTVLQSKDFNVKPLMYRVNKIFIEKSRFIEYLYVKIFNLKKASAFHKEMSEKEQYNSGYQFFILDPEHFLSRDEAFRNKSWEQTQKYILALKDLVKENQSRFAVFYIPLESQLKLDQYGKHIAVYTPRHMGRYFNNLLKEFHQNNEMHFLDLLDTFEKHKDMGLYLNRDGHLTIAGHKMAAHALFDFLRDENLIPFKL